MQRPAAAQFWLFAAPALFVVLWSTGFIGAKLGLPYIEPFTFLGIRMLTASGLLLAVALLMRAPWPREPWLLLHLIVAGLLVHGVYLAGVFTAIELGLSAGVAAIIVAVQPLLTAALAGRLLGERVTLRQWAGLALGLAGVLLVVWSKLSAGSLGGVFAALAALLGITIGTLYQKRYCPSADIRTAGTLQYLVTGALLMGLAGIFETMQIQWSGELIFAMTWLVLVLSVGAVGLLYVLIRHGAAARVASLFYLAPPFVAIFGYWLFGETLEPRALLGLAVVVAGVALVNVPARAARRPA
jgi:drug/metabolite transporter (DMT)-like permease